MFEKILIPFEDVDFEYRTAIAVLCDNPSNGYLKYKIEVLKGPCSLEQVKRIKRVLEGIPNVEIVVTETSLFYIIYFEFPDNLFPLFRIRCRKCYKERIVFPYIYRDIDPGRVPEERDISWRCAGCSVTCTTCGETIPHYYQRSLPVHTLDRDPYCERCVPHCANCGCVLGDDRWYPEYYEVGGNLYCDECARPCAYCYVPHLVDELCPECESCPNCCRCSQEEEESEYEIMTYSYKPAPKFHKLEHENPLYLGIELEIEANMSHYPDDIIKTIRDELNLSPDVCYFKHDSSLGSKGVEIVFHPSTLRYMTKVIKIVDVLKELRKVAVSYNTGRCGIHVHIPKSSLTLSEKRKLVCFTSKCKKYLVKFSKRDLTQIERWCRFYNNNAYKFNENFWKDSRYYVVNFCPSRTIEFRLFRGTLYSPRFLAFLRFVVALVDYVKSVGIAHIALNDDDQVWRDFVKFTSKKHPHLYKFFKEDGLAI